MLDLIASRYRVLRELGRGGMGVVYVVEHTRTGDQLALKLLHGRAAKDGQAIERFKREARASARIKSEHVVKVVDADIAPELENAPFLVMELLDGQDLQKLVSDRGRLQPAEVAEYLTQAARALDKSHALGIVHRDLKPENLFLHRREDGSAIIKILDFGISKIIGAEGGGDMTGAGMTNTGAIMGTPLFMSPEQARGLVSHIGPTTDVWAVGLIAIHLLTGEVYWTANTIAELMVHILAEPMYAPTRRWPWLPPGIDEWFARSCARDAALRFRTVGEQVDALAAALGLRGPAFESTFQAPAPPLAPAPPAPMPVPSVPGATTTTHPHSMGTTGAAPASVARPSKAPLVLALCGSIGLLAAIGGGAWVVRGQIRPGSPSSALAGQPPSVPPSVVASMSIPSSTPSQLPVASAAPPDAGASAPAAGSASVPATSSSARSAHAAGAHAWPVRQETDDPWAAKRTATPQGTPPGTHRPFTPVSP